MMSKISPELKPFVTIVDGIASTLGNSCEVVLHDLSHPKTSVIYVKNGHVTGRKVGDGIRDLIFDVLTSPDFKEDALTKYESTVVKGKSIKSTTMVIRNMEEKIIGALCINLDITNLNLILSTVGELTSINKVSKDSDENIEIEKADVLDILDHIISHTILESGKLPENMKKDDFLKIIKFMDEKGVFLIKNSVDWVARKLNLSKFTVYGYLKEVRIDEEIQRR